MTQKRFFAELTNTKEDVISRFFEILNQNNIRYCLIGGLAVNAYCEPVVSLDVDIVVKESQIERLLRLLGDRFSIKREKNSINIKSPDSDIRIQIQIDARYQEFIERAEEREVFGMKLYVADIKDLLKSKLWSAEDPDRRRSKRHKDIADVLRLAETYPELEERIPREWLR
jgi:hypothetical protein